MIGKKVAGWLALDYVNAQRRFDRVTRSLLFTLLLTLSCLLLPCKQDLHRKGDLHDLAHFVVFVLLTSQASRGAISSVQRAGFFVGLGALASVIEIAQQCIMKTQMEWLDVLLDWAGIAVILIVVAAFDRKRAAL